MRKRVHLDMVRVVATALIFVFHFVKDFDQFGDWGTVGTGVKAGIIAFASLSRHAGITSFVILSGLTLPWAWQHATGDWSRYLRRRVRRLMPQFWVVAVPFIVMGLLVGEMTTADLWKVPFWLSGLNWITRATFEPVSAAWWYVGLALQLVVVTPLLYEGVKRWGAVRIGIAVAFVDVALSLAFAASPATAYLTVGFAGCRLLEVYAGVLIGFVVLSPDAQAPDSRWLYWIGACAAVALSAGVAYLMPGPSLYPALGRFVAAAMVFTACLVKERTGHDRSLAAWAWLAALSYPFYLSHAPLAKYSIRALGARGLSGFVFEAVVALAIALVVAWGFMALERWLLRSFPARVSGAESP